MNDLNEPLLISGDDQRSGRRPNVEFLLDSKHLNLFDGMIDNLNQSHWPAFEREFARLEPRHIEEVVGQPAEMAELLPELSDHLAEPRIPARSFLIVGG